MKPASLLAVVVFSLVALSHLLRLALQVEVLVGGAVIPMWVSVVGLLVTALLAIGLWRESRSPGLPENAA